MTLSFPLVPADIYVCIVSVGLCKVTCLLAALTLLSSWSTLKSNRVKHFQVSNQYVSLYKFCLRNLIPWEPVLWFPWLYPRANPYSHISWELQADWLQGFQKPYRNDFHRVLCRGRSWEDLEHGSHLYRIFIFWAHTVLKI